MTFDVRLGIKTTLGNVTRYEFSVTRNPTLVDPMSAGTRYSGDPAPKKDALKTDTKSEK